MNQQSPNSPSHGFAINLTDICMAFETRLVLDKINLQIPPGQALCLCGINGAGKTTLLRIVTGLLHPTRGQVRINGVEPRKGLSLAQASIGVISHQSMLYHDLTVAENLRFFARLYGVKNQGRRVDDMLEDVGLARYRHERTGILSRGMLQRLAIARALIHKPGILLADEPFTGLDLQAAGKLIEVVEQFRDAGGAIIMTTHEINLGLKCCDRVVVLDGARLIFDAGIDQLDRDSFTRDYLSYARENS